MKATYAILVIPKQPNSFGDFPATLYIRKLAGARYATMLVFTNKRKALSKAAKLRKDFLSHTYAVIKYEVQS